MGRERRAIRWDADIGVSDGCSGAPETGVAIQTQLGATRGRDESFTVDRSREAREAVVAEGVAR